MEEVYKVQSCVRKVFTEKIEWTTDYYASRQSVAERLVHKEIKETIDLALMANVDNINIHKIGLDRWEIINKVDDDETLLTDFRIKKVDVLTSYVEV